MLKSSVGCVLVSLSCSDLSQQQKVSLWSLATTIRSQSPHYYRPVAVTGQKTHTLQHTHSVGLTLLFADVINSPCCDWLVWVPKLACAGFDSSSGRCGLQEDKGHSGTWKRYPLAVGATVLCSAVYHLTLHNWVHTSTKWRSMWRPTEREGRVYQRERQRTLLVTCTVLPPCFFSVSVEGNGQTVSSASEGLRASSLLPYSL